LPQKAKRIAVSIVNPPPGHRDVTSLAHAKRYVRDGVAEFVPGKNAIEFKAIAKAELVQKLAQHVGPPLDARAPRPARVTWPAQFSEIMGERSAGLPEDPAYLVHFLNQGGIGLDQRSSRGKAAA